MYPANIAADECWQPFFSDTAADFLALASDFEEGEEMELEILESLENEAHSERDFIAEYVSTRRL